MISREMVQYNDDQLGHTKMRFQNLSFGLLNQHFSVSLNSSGPHFSSLQNKRVKPIVSKVPTSSKILYSSNNEMS